MDKISIIVPVYNGEKFLRKCVDSLIGQTYGNVEILLLDDGSSDGSLAILKEYEEKFPEKIRIASHPNMGQGATRNKGVEMAGGKYITFVDCDDYVLPDYVQTLAENIGDNDILISGYSRVNESGQVLRTNLPREKEWVPYKFCATCGKLFKTSFFREKGIKYEPFRIGEDVCMALHGVMATNKIGVIPYGGYCYLVNANSVTNTAKLQEETRYNMLPALERIDSFAKENCSVDMLLFFYEKTCVLQLLSQSGVLSRKAFREESAKYWSWLERKYAEHGKRLGWRWQKGEEFYINCFVNFAVLCHRLHGNGVFAVIAKRCSGAELKV